MLVIIAGILPWPLLEIISEKMRYLTYKLRRRDPDIGLATGKKKHILLRIGLAVILIPSDRLEGNLLIVTV